MKPKCSLGHNRPKDCTQTLFGLNLEIRNGVAVIHGDLKVRKG